MTKKLNLRELLFLLLLTATGSSAAQEHYTRGIGIYPGKLQECFAPQLVTDTVYRNIAQNRPVYTSSCYDYNLTGHLATDGIIGQEPVFLEVITPTGNLPKREREWTIDGGEYSRNVVAGASAFLHYLLHGYHITFDKIQVVMQVAYEEDKAVQGHEILLRNGETGSVKVLSKDHVLPGKRSGWKVPSDPNKQTGEATLPQQNIELTVAMDEPWNTGDFSLEMQMAGAVYWTVYEVKFFLHDKAVNDILPSSHFSSLWRSEDNAQQWVYVDLGNICDIQHIIPYWLEKPDKVSVLLSDDAENWHAPHAIPSDTAYYCKEKARYVKVLMEGSSTPCFALSELQVMGRGGVRSVPCDVPDCSDGKMLLNGGPWKLCRASLTGDMTGEQLSSPGVDDSQWITATVPATVVTSYVNNGTLPDPNYDDNLFLQSESFFRSNFWYRRTFSVPETFLRKHVMLHFDGINWKANIFLNGRRIDRIEGAFKRGETDITEYLREGENVLAVEIVCNEHYAAVKEKNETNTDFNGGMLGADNPTFHATVGWDWISTIRGRDMGIWNDVYLTVKGDVTVRDPFIRTTLNLPDTLATLTPQVMVKNLEKKTIEGTLRMWVGDIRCEKTVRLSPQECREVVFSPQDYPQLRDRRLRLWWPNGYGEAYLYKAGFEFVIDNHQTDRVCFSAGIREMRYQDEDTALKLFVNGKRFIPLGGNWGFSENHLNYRAREYDIAVGYHRDMHFTMIRNWVGQTGDEEFYEACDRHGIMVWQDFWLANPADGPDPADEQLFMSNADDYILRIRQHPCLALYCGRNEGFPPPTLNEQLVKSVKDHHSGLLYIPSSADGGVGGHGPYHALMTKDYFSKPMLKLHTERGMPNVMTFEGLSRTLRKEHRWPQNNYWGQHDFTQQGAQRGSSFNDLVHKALGATPDAKTFTQYAQWINYNGYRAMFESNHLTRSGLLIWMSHPSFPSMTWQTYDYYFEPTAAYFACKKACEPLHLQWNVLTDSIQLVNLYVKDSGKMTATAEILDMNGKPVWKKKMQVQPMPDTTTNLFSIPHETVSTDVCFLRLTLREKKKVLSENTYVCGPDDNTQVLRHLPEAEIYRTVRKTGDSTMTVTLKNLSKVPALMIRLNLVADDGEQILPVHYSDNYFHLMPGEEKWVKVSWKTEDARGLPVRLELSNLNQCKE